MPALTLLSIPIASRMCGMTLPASRLQVFAVASMMIGCSLMYAIGSPPWTADLFAVLWCVFRIPLVKPGFDATHPEYDAERRNKGMWWMVTRAMLILPLFMAVGYFSCHQERAIYAGFAGAMWMGLSYRFAPEVYAWTGKPIVPNVYNAYAEWSEAIGWMVLFGGVIL